MTWYWWSHWFWITVIVVTLTTFPIISIETYPMNPPYGNKEYDKDKPLQFPLAAQTDDQTTFIGGDEMLTVAIREGKYLRHNKESEHNSNAGHDDSIGKNNQITNVSSNTLSAKGENSSNLTESIVKANRTKAVDVSLVNNKNSNNNNNNNSSSILSIKTTSKPQTISSGIVSSSSTTHSDLIGVADDINITYSHPDTNASDVNDYDSNDSSFSTSSEEFLQNQTSSSSSSSSSSSLSSSSSSSSSSSNVEFLIGETSTFKKSYNLENITKEEEVIRAEIEKQLDGERGRKSKVLAEYRQEMKFINFSSSTKNLLARSAAISLDDLVEQDDDKVSSEALSIQRAYILDAGAISGICFAVFSIFCGITIAGIALYRRRYLNKPQTLSEPDSSGYIDDSTIRDNSDEMYSLDNDSFLNSLEAMTIQNYWTDTVKHTKL